MTSSDAIDKFQVWNDFCKESSSPQNLECYYEPWSSCTLEDALGGKDGIQMNRAMHDRRMHRLNIQWKDIVENFEEVINNYKGPSITEYELSEALQKRLDTDSEREGALNDLRNDLEPFQTVIIWNQVPFRLVIPKLVLPFVDNCLPMPKQYWYYWWRAGEEINAALHY